MAKGYWVALVDVSDPDGYKAYIAENAKPLRKFGGCFLARGVAFTSETFILSFSLPNFHFHAVTAYNILRSRGVAAALGRAGMDDELARDVIERPQHRDLLTCPGAGARKSAPDFAQAWAR